MENFIKRALTGLVLSMLVVAPLILLPSYYFSCILGLILLYILMYEWPQLFDVRTQLFWLLMPLYPILPFVLLLLLNQQESYHKLVYLLFASVAAHDTGAYLAGNLLGYTKIAPQISRNKTVEGFIGGYLLACIALGGILYTLGGKLHAPTIAFFSLIVCTVAFAGDLFESWLKRRAYIKDSGTILPGHGGFLDRFDGILFATFFFYSAKDWILQLFF